MCYLNNIFKIFRSEGLPEIKQQGQETLVKPPLVNLTPTPFMHCHRINEFQDDLQPVLRTNSVNSGFPQKIPEVIIHQVFPNDTDNNLASEKAILKKSNSMSNIAKQMNPIYQEKSETVFSDVRHYTHCQESPDCNCRCLEKVKSFNENRVCHERNENGYRQCDVRKLDEKQCSAHFQTPYCSGLNRIEETKSSYYGPVTSNHSSHCLSMDCRSSVVTSVSKKCNDLETVSANTVESCRIAVDGIKVGSIR